MTAGSGVAAIKQPLKHRFFGLCVVLTTANLK